MEVEFFVKPGTGFEWLDKWLEERLLWYEAIGIPRAKIHVLTVPTTDRAFYSKGTYDLEYEFPFGIQELEGVAYRTDYDLTQHMKASGKPLEYSTRRPRRNTSRMSSSRARAWIAPSWPLLCEPMTRKR